MLVKLCECIIHLHGNMFLIKIHCLITVKFNKKLCKNNCIRNPFRQVYLKKLLNIFFKKYETKLINLMMNKIKT